MKLAHDLWPSRIEYLSNPIALSRKDRAKRYHKSSIVIRQYSIPVRVTPLAMDINCHRCYKLSRFPRNWPPARGARAMEGILQQFPPIELLKVLADEP
jgi:hypothetical protein